jgi:cation:H+ antiporter
MVCPACWLTAIGYFLLGLVGILWGADKVLDGIGDLSKKLKASPLILGVLIMGIDLEEFIASTIAASNGLPEIAIGNVIGNTIISLTFCFALPGIVVAINFKKIDVFYIWILELASIVLLIALLTPSIIGIIGLVALAIFVYYLFRSVDQLAKERNHRRSSESEKPHEEEKEHETEDITNEENEDETEEITDEENEDNDVVDDEIEPDESVKKIVILMIVGLVVLFIGSDFLIRGVKDLITLTGWGEGFFGLLIIAAATNIEEYFILIQSIRTKRVEIGVGAMIGKTLWNLCVTFGVSGLLMWTTGTPSTGLLQNSLLLSFIIIPIYLIIAKAKGQLGRSTAMILLVCFLLYIGFTFASI